MAEENKSMTIDEQIKIIDENIYKTLSEMEEQKRGHISQNVLSQLRNLVEAAGIKIVCKDGSKEYRYADILPSFQKLNHIKGLDFLVRLKKYISEVASHYTLDEYNSKFVVQKYVAYLIRLRDYMKSEFDENLLENVEKLLAPKNENLQKYYSEISKGINEYRLNNEELDEYFYPISSRPIIVGGRIIYETALSKSHRKSSKLGNIIAYSSVEVDTCYRIKCKLAKLILEIEGASLPYSILVSYDVAAYPREINMLGKIVGISNSLSGRHREYKNLMSYISATAKDLLDIIEFDNLHFNQFSTILTNNVDEPIIIKILKKCRNHISRCRPGTNVLRYILETLSNDILSQVVQDTPNDWFGNLCINNQCKPFDSMPFCSSLPNHNPQLITVMEAILPEGREDELFAKSVQMKAEEEGRIFNTFDDLKTTLEDAKALIDKYNSKLWRGHSNRMLKIYANKYVYIEGYAEVTASIINNLRDCSRRGIQNFANYVNSQINDANNNLLDKYSHYNKEKIDLMLNMFSTSGVCIVNGPAGTGKTTIIECFNQIFSTYNNVYLANTIPATENIRRRCSGLSSDKCMTLKKFLRKHKGESDVELDFLILDECSTIPNREMQVLLNMVKCKGVLLVGDPFQLGAITFGNWFNLINRFLPDTAHYELKQLFRASGSSLSNLWEAVRNLDDDIQERMAHSNYLSGLNNSIFSRVCEDEIILALNYNGLYGINNINAYFQANNSSPSVSYGAHIYKVGDPILFEDTERFKRIFNNNLKGIICKIIDSAECIEFHIYVNKVILFDNADCSVLPIPEGAQYDADKWSLVSFKVYKRNEDADQAPSEIFDVPFQIAYAVSIHKAQGLEYDSVKIVITDDVEDLVTHDVFYTAITRAKSHLKIYWDNPSMQSIFDMYRTAHSGLDATLLANVKPLADIS